MDPSGTIAREGEIALMQAFLAEVRHEPAGLLIEGEVGVGKTTLWHEAVREARARSFRTLTCRPAEAEDAIAFAGLIGLLGPVADEACRTLPPPQRRALESALLRATADAPVEAGAVAIAVAGALQSLAAAGPLAVAVDDLQWLDAPTRRALAFALRRVAAPIAVVVAQRIGVRVDPLLDATSMTHLRVPPLSMGAVYQLIHSRLGTALPRPMLVRIHETSGGNPFFALELARALADRDTGLGAGEHLPVRERLADLVGSRLERLDARVRNLLLMVAAMASPSVGDVLEAAGEKAEADIEAAEEAGMLDSRDGTVRFTHPVLAAAVYDGATGAERRKTHGRLAATATDPEERARHLALAAVGPSEDVAAALDAAAERAAGRGATDVAARYAEQALFLTPAGGAMMFRRALAGGIHAAAAGDRAHARALLERAVADAPGGAERAEALLRLAEISDPLGYGLALCDRALADAGDDAALASRIHRIRGAIAYFLGDVPAAEAHARTAVELAEAGGRPEALGAAVAELAHWTYCGGGGVRRDLFERAVSLDDSPGALSPRSHMAKVLMDHDDLDESRTALESLLAESLDAGDLSAASAHLFHLAELESWAGRWDSAVAHADESLQLRTHSDRPYAPLYAKAMALACRGDVERARALAESGLAQAERADDVVFRMQNHHVLGFIELSLGRHEAARPHLQQASELMRPRWSREFGDCHVVPDEVEALVALGDLVRSEDLTAWMEDVASHTQRAWTLATGARARALVQSARNDLDGAAAVVERSLAAHEGLPMPFERGRTLLVKGILQRRMKQRSAARKTLDAARGLFESLGAPLWTAKADAELERIGVRTRAQTDLTPIEMRIATLVAGGKRNREIADLLSLSPKTVEANLSRTYRKLGIRSRTELAAKLAEP